MKRAFDGGTLPIAALDRGAPQSLHRQIYAAYRKAIATRRLRPGARLPSTRSLAEELGVSRAPVLAAFEQLLAEGFIQGKVGAGTFVAPSLRLESPTDLAPKGRGARVISQVSTAAVESTPWLSGLETFRMSLPALEHLPVETWATIVARQARRMSRRSYAYADPFGAPALREVLADYLATSRGVRCTPEQIMIVSGSQQALVLCARVLVDPGAPVWIEEPGYSGARSAFEFAGAKLVPVPVDAHGLDVAAASSRKARAVYVTPSHQYPLGVTMSAQRRLELLEWARSTGAWVIEDDYDSEFRFESPPIAALQGLDADERVIYIGTFSKVLFPSLRVGYLVIPKDLLGPFGRTRDTLDIFPPALPQMALAEFLREGHFATHLRRMRTVYRERRTALVNLIRDELGSAVELLGAEAGMHLVLQIPAGSDDVAISKAAAARGVAAMPLSPTYANASLARAGLVLGFAGTPPEKMREGMRVLKDVIATGRSRALHTSRRSRADRA